AGARGSGGSAGNRLRTSSPWRLRRLPVDRVLTDGVTPPAGLAPHPFLQGVFYTAQLRLVCIVSRYRVPAVCPCARDVPGRSPVGPTSLQAWTRLEDCRIGSVARSGTGARTFS